MTNKESIISDENTYYTKVKVIFNDGSEFVGNEIQVALVSGFTATYRGGVKQTLFLEGIPIV